MKKLERFYECNEPNVIFEKFDDETIVVNLDSGRYYSLDPVGAIVWDLLHRPLPVGDLLARLKEHYDGDGGAIEESIREFIAKMADEELIRPRPDATAATDDGEELEKSTAFVPPVLATYEDMAEMLLLDPVHDVDETGWPQEQKDAGPGKPAADKGGLRVEDDDVSSWPSLDDEK
jgi:hypothetical protein